MVSNLATQLHNGVGKNIGQIRRSRAFGACSLLMVAAFAFATSCFAAPIAVPNGDFSDPANVGHVGGGLIGGSGSDAIGNGPWNGTYKGIASLLAPPRLTITPGHATISGLAGVRALNLSIVNNSGYFSENLTSAYAPDTRYTLSANVDVGAVLSVGLLNSGNAGIALTRGTTELASTANADPATVSLSLVDGTRYKLTLTYSTSASVSGNIGVKLFSKPQNLLTANLLSSVTFSNVTLSGGAINPVAASISSGRGTPQGATVNTAFAAPLSVTVLDAAGDPVPNATVTFSAPASGPSATLSPTTVTTDANGVAQTTGTANGIAGSYVVTASVAGVATPAQFQLTNIAGGAAAVSSSSGTPQSATVNTAFATPLGVTVIDADGNPVQGITVMFSAPSSGPSASFPNGATAMTDANGQAQVTASANTIAGNYVITASVNGVGVSASFALTNVAGPVANASPIGGTPQTATISTAFNTPLSAQFTDAFGNPISGVEVTFTAPTSGPSATFPPDGTTTITVMSDENGIVTLNATANSIPGSYEIVATSPGLPDVIFDLTNSAAQVPVVTTTSGTNQDTNVQAAFQCLLQLRVTSDGTTPIPNMSIDFLAPASGPSAMLSNGTTSGTDVTMKTDSNGLAGVTATANAVAGTYNISANLTSNGSAIASYVLTNLDATDRIFSDGFEGTPALCP